MFVYQCEDSLSGIFTAIYNVYEDRRSREEVRLDLTEELLLFAEYCRVVPNEEKTKKVIRTLRERFGEEDYEKLCFALSAQNEEKAQWVYQTVARGLRCRIPAGHLFDNLADRFVADTFSLWRAANNEFLHLRGFIRFRELENGVMYAEISPKNNILVFLMPHFADRFPQENFLLHDYGRGLAGVHPAGGGWYAAHMEERGKREKLVLSESELQYQELFRRFCGKIAIRERENASLQRNMLPLRFRGDMVEFSDAQN